MRCDKHGELIQDWTSCPYCIRDGQRRDPAGPPRPPSLENWGASPPAGGGGGAPASATRGNAGGIPGGGGGFAGRPAGDVTRGNFGGGGGGAPAGAGVTRGAGADVNGFGRSPANVTRIVDPPPLARRKVRAWLIQKDGPRPDQVHPVKDDVTWIGRDPRTDIFLDNDSVSSQHVKLWVDDDKRLHLLNVSTSNGTHVNGVRVDAPVELRENDEVRMGTVVLVLKRLDEPPAKGAAAATPMATAAPAPAPAPAAPAFDPNQPGLDEKLAALVKQMVEAQVAAARAAAAPAPAPAAVVTPVPPAPAHVPPAPEPVATAAPAPVHQPPAASATPTVSDVAAELEPEPEPVAAADPPSSRVAPTIPAPVFAPAPEPAAAVDPWAAPAPAIDETQPMARAALPETVVMPEPARPLKADETWTAPPPSAVGQTVPGTLPNPFRQGGV